MDEAQHGVKCRRLIRNIDTTYKWEMIRKTKKINCISSPNCYDLLHNMLFTPYHFLTLHVLQREHN